MWRVTRPLSTSCRLFCKPSRYVQVASCSTADGPYWYLDHDQFYMNHSSDDVRRMALEGVEMASDPRLIVSEELVKRCSWTLEPKDDSLLFKVKRTVFRAAHLTRAHDVYTGPLFAIIEDQLNNEKLIERFGIPFEQENFSRTPSLHWNTAPKEQQYNRLRMRIYFLVLHIWCVHHPLITQGAFGQKLDREVFNLLYNIIRVWFSWSDVPTMSLEKELISMQEFIFGFLLVLDDAVESLDTQTISYAKVKHAIWANVYFGAVPHDDPQLMELAIYAIRQYRLCKAIDPECITHVNFSFADFPSP